MDRTDLAWAAGFWDGEGWSNLVRFGRGDALRPMARVNQADLTGIPHVLQRFQQAVGLGQISGPDLELGREPLYKWVASAKDDVDRLFELIGPWLGGVKHRQFEATCGRSVTRIAWSEVAPDAQRAWAAGLFDGEGSVYLARHQSHRGYYLLEAAITQASWDGSPEVLERFLEVSGIGKIYGPYPGGGGYAPVYRWKAHRCQQIELMIGTFSAHLGPVKRDQAAAAIEVLSGQPPLLRGNPAWGNRKTHCVSGHEYATARIRPYNGRGKNLGPPRASHQCLACVRHGARMRRERGPASSG